MLRFLQPISVCFHRDDILNSCPFVEYQQMPFYTGLNGRNASVLANYCGVPARMDEMNSVSLSRFLQDKFRLADNGWWEEAGAAVTYSPWYTVTMI